jgi:hypothetical protein
LKPAPRDGVWETPSQKNKNQKTTHRTNKWQLLLTFQTTVNPPPKRIMLMAASAFWSWGFLVTSGLDCEFHRSEGHNLVTLVTMIRQAHTEHQGQWGHSAAHRVCISFSPPASGGGAGLFPFAGINGGGRGGTNQSNPARTPHLGCGVRKNSLVLIISERGRARVEERGQLCLLSSTAWNKHWPFGGPWCLANSQGAQARLGDDTGTSLAGLTPPLSFWTWISAAGAWEFLEHSLGLSPL